MNTFRINVQSLWRKELTSDDDALGRNLVSLLRKAIGGRAAPAAALVVRSDRIDLMPLKQVVDRQIGVGQFLAGLSASSVPDRGHDVEAVGLIGTFTRRQGNAGPGIPMAMVFLEWTDCRWWQWSAIIDPDAKALRDDTETWMSAHEGDGKPHRLGGWWSLGRRKNMNVRLDPVVH